LILGNSQLTKSSIGWHSHGHHKTAPGRQQGVVASRQQGVTLRTHPTGIEELVGELLLNCLELFRFPEKMADS